MPAAADAVQTRAESPVGRGSEPSVPRGQGRAALTAAAREVFAERGYHGASIREIARRAGLSLSALYHWHAGKEDLLAEVLSDSRHDYLQACADALAAVDTGDSVARLSALVTATVDYRVRRRVESALGAQELRNLPPHHLVELDRLRDAASAMWSDVVDGGVRAGVFECDAPDDARRSVAAACNAISQWYDPDGPVGVDELAARYVRIALRIVDHRP